MIKTYFLKYVGNEPTRARTKDGKLVVTPGEVFETDIYHFKDMLKVYPRLFKEVEIVGKDEAVKSDEVADSKPSIEELRAMFVEKEGHEVSTRYKNDYNYIYKKVFGEG